jgi:hypothetical protein
VTGGGTCANDARPPYSSFSQQRRFDEACFEIFDLLLGRQSGGVAMHPWLLEACVVFAIALTFVIAFRLNK